MKNTHIEKFKINDTDVDFKSKLSVCEIIKFLQIATFNHSNLIGLGHKPMEQKSNAFWVVTKIKVLINNNISSGDEIKVKTWTHPLTAIRANRDFNIKQKNRVMVKAAAEWCCLDYNTRKIRKLESIAYPDLEMVETKQNNIVFCNLTQEFTSKDYVYTKQIRATDIDINVHTNNLKYNTMALDAFSVEELKSFSVKEYEIHFVNESHEGDTIDIYKKKVGNCFYLCGRAEEKVVFRVLIKTKKCK